MSMLIHKYLSIMTAKSIDPDRRPSWTLDILVVVGRSPLVKASNALAAKCRPGQGRMVIQEVSKEKQEMEIGW